MKHYIRLSHLEGTVKVLSGINPHYDLPRYAKLENKWIVYGVVLL